MVIVAAGGVNAADAVHARVDDAAAGAIVIV